MTIRWEWVIEHFPNTSVASFDDFTLKIWQKWYENVSKRMARTASICQGSLRPEVHEGIYSLLRLLMLKVSKEISEPFRQQVTGRGFKEMNLTNASPTPIPESTLFRAPTRTPISESTLFRTPTRTPISKSTLFLTSPASCNPFVNSRGTVTRIIRHTRHISESTPTNHVSVVGPDSPSPSPLKSRSAVRPLGINSRMLLSTNEKIVRKFRILLTRQWISSRLLVNASERRLLLHRAPSKNQFLIIRRL